MPSTEAPQRLRHSPRPGAFCAPPGKTLTVVPRFPTQKGSTDGSAYGVARGRQRKAGDPSKPRPPGASAPAAGAAAPPHLRRLGRRDSDLPFRTRDTWPDSHLGNHPVARQSEARPPEGRLPPSTPQGPPLSGRRGRLTRRPLRGPGEQLGHSPGPTLPHSAILQGSRGDVETPLRCHQNTTQTCELDVKLSHCK